MVESWYFWTINFLNLSDLETLWYPLKIPTPTLAPWPLLPRRATEDIPGSTVNKEFPWVAIQNRNPPAFGPGRIRRDGAPPGGGSVRIRRDVRCLARSRLLFVSSSFQMVKFLLHTRVPFRAKTRLMNQSFISNNQFNTNSSLIQSWQSMRRYEIP